MGTLVYLLHQHSAQAQFAVAQTYMGRRLDQLHAVGSFSVQAPMHFSFGAEASLYSTCQHVLKETLQLMRDEVVLPVSRTHRPAVAYELNDLRPMSRPPGEATRLLTGMAQPLAELFFLVNQYSDGYSVQVLCEPGKYDGKSIESLVVEWMEMWVGSVK